jgi:hypothetical protein
MYMYITIDTNQLDLLSFSIEVRVSIYTLSR